MDKVILMFHLRVIAVFNSVSGVELPTSHVHLVTAQKQTPPWHIVLNLSWRS